MSVVVVENEAAKESILVELDTRTMDIARSTEYDQGDSMRDRATHHPSKAKREDGEVAFSLTNSFELDEGRLSDDAEPRQSRFDGLFDVLCEGDDCGLGLPSNVRDRSFASLNSGHSYESEATNPTQRGRSASYITL